ncbi:MAG: hypothetical protein LC800_12235 [Acidobacteria bacterium]|nr:hypothetical protein [Acidobacteriota bacterium]
MKFRRVRREIRTGGEGASSGTSSPSGTAGAGRRSWISLPASPRGGSRS